MAEQWFLEIDGIEGESTNARHPKEIDIDAWSFGAAATNAGHSGSGSGSGKVVHDPFTFRTTMSIATPRLFAACVQGTHLRSAKLAGVRSGAGIEFVAYALEDVTVSSARQGDGAGGPPYDEFTLEFRELTITYRPQRPNGSAGTPVTVTYSR